MTKARDIADFKFEDIVDTGTEGTKVAAGTTAQRGSTTGQWRYNTTTGFFEGRNASGDFSTLEPTPTISSVDVTEVESAAGGNQTFVITGTNFTSGGVIAFVGSSAQFDASTTTFNSATQVTAVAAKASFLNAQEPYKIKFTSSSGVAGTSGTGLINVDNAPTWNTASGTVATITDNATGTHATLSATDAEGDTVAYSETGATNITGAGLSLNSSTGVISGDPTDVANSTTVSFTGRATANSKTTDRSFNIIINPTLDGTSSGRAFSSISSFNSLGTLSSAGYYDRYVTLNGAVSAYQQKLYYDGTNTWYVVSPVFNNGGGLINNTAVGFAEVTSLGSFKTIVNPHNRSVSGSGTWNYISGANVQALIGTTLTNTGSEGAYPSTDSASSVVTQTGQMTSLGSWRAMTYYDHVAGSNYASSTVTALRNVVTELNYKTAWQCITGDDDGASTNNTSSTSWNNGTTIYSNSTGGTPATIYFKDTSGSVQKLMAGQSNDNEAMAVTWWSHNAALGVGSTGTTGNSAIMKYFGGSPSYTGGLKTTAMILPAEYNGENGSSSTAFTSPLYDSTIGKLNSRLVLLVK